jgi:hypothetical protein
MKFLKTMPIMLLAAMLMTACGKNDSGSSSSSSTGVVTSGTIGTDGLPTSTGTNFTTIEQLRSHVASASMAVNAGTLIVRSDNFGRFEGEEVTSSSASSATLREVIYYAGENSPNNQYGNPRTLLKSDAIYTEMLMQNPQAQCDQVQLRPVSIFVADINNTNQKTLQGVRVTCLEITGTVVQIIRSRQSAIYTSALPLAANPISLSNSDIELGNIYRVGRTRILGVQ